MQLALILWIIWGILLLLTIIVKIYAARTSRDEDDQLVLQDSFDNVKAEQAAIASRLHKVQPLQNALWWLLGAMTLVVIGYYGFDVFRQLYQ